MNDINILNEKYLDKKYNILNNILFVLLFKNNSVYKNINNININILFIYLNLILTLLNDNKNIKKLQINELSKKEFIISKDTNNFYISNNYELFYNKIIDTLNTKEYLNILCKKLNSNTYNIFDYQQLYNEFLKSYNKQQLTEILGGNDKNYFYYLKYLHCKNKYLNLKN